MVRFALRVDDWIGSFSTRANGLTVVVQRKLPSSVNPLRLRDEARSRQHHLSQRKSTPPSTASYKDGEELGQRLDDNDLAAIHGIYDENPGD